MRGIPFFLTSLCYNQRRVKKREESDPMTKTKNYNLELIRTASFPAVVAIHVTNYFCRAYGEVTQGAYLFSLAFDVLARFCVPCFFMLTGALLLGREESLEKHGKRLAHMLLVFVIWSLIYYVWNTCFMGKAVDLGKICYTPVEKHLWYLYAILPIYLALPFFQVLCWGMTEKLEKAFLVLTTAAVVISYLMSMIPAEPYYDLPLVGDRSYTYYVFLGYFLEKYKDKIRIGQKGLAAIFGISTALNFAITWGMTAASGIHFERVMEYGCPLVILEGASFFLFFARLKGGSYRPKEQTRKWIDSWCACSFGIYLIHVLFLDLFKKQVDPAEVSAWIAIPVLIPGILLLSYFSVRLLRVTRVGRKIT